MTSGAADRLRSCAFLANNKRGVGRRHDARRPIYFFYLKKPAGLTSNFFKHFVLDRGKWMSDPSILQHRVLMGLFLIQYQLPDFRGMTSTNITYRELSVIWLIYNWDDTKNCRGRVGWVAAHCLLILGRLLAFIYFKWRAFFVAHWPPLHTWTLVTEKVNDFQFLIWLLASLADFRNSWCEKVGVVIPNTFKFINNW